MRDVLLVPIDKKTVQTTCMWCGRYYADYFVVRVIQFSAKIRAPLTICEKCAEKEGMKHGGEVSVEDADSGEQSSRP